MNVNGSVVGTLDGTSTVVATVAGSYGTLTITGNGDWTYELTAAADHQAVPTPVDSFVVTVNDGIQQSAAAATLDFGIIDDTIAVTQTSDTYLVNSANSVVNGILQVAGADDNYSADLSGNIAGWNGSTTVFMAAPSPNDPTTPLTSDGHQVYYYVDPADTSVLYAYTDTGSVPSAYGSANPTQSLLFTLSADPATDSYQFHTYGTNGLAFTDVMNLGMANGGNDNFLVMYHDPTQTNPYVVQGFGTFADWQATTGTVHDNAIMIMSGTSAADTVNWSTQGIGVDNNAMNGNEVLRMDFSDAPGQSVYGATIGFTGLSGTEGYTWTAVTANGQTYTGGSSASSLNISGLGELSEVTVTADAGSTFRIDPPSTVLSFAPAGDIGPFNFTIGVSDGDLNSSSTSVGITLTNGTSAVGTAADDTILYDSSFSTIDGGAGFDSLMVPDGQTLDFSKLSNIEQLDLSQSGDHSITLQYQDVLDISGTNELHVLGDSGDQMNLSNAAGGGSWSLGSAAPIVENGHSFLVYQTDTGATVKVEDTVQVNII